MKLRCPMLVLSFAALGAISAGAALKLLTARVASIPRGPHLEFPQEAVDLGTMEPAQHITRVFEVRSVGTEAVKITKLSTNCGCTVAALDRPAVPPGAKARIAVTFDSTGFSREINKQIFVQSNDANHPAVVVHVRGYVRVGLRADATVLNLGQVRAGGTASGEVHLVRDRGTSTEPIRVSSETAQVRADVGPWSPYFEAERAAIRLEVPEVSDEVGCHYRNAELSSGSEKFRVKLDYEVLPVVRSSPSEVSMSANSSLEKTVHLSWSGHDPVFEGAVAQDDKCAGRIRTAHAGGWELVITPHSGKINRQGDFDLLRVSYALPDLARHETVVIPVVFLAQVDTGVHD